MTAQPRSHRTWVARLCAAALLGVSLASCHGGDRAASPPEPNFTNWPKALGEFRFRWSAEPGIDLLLGPAIPLRAYLESYRLVEFTLDVNAAYPGFARAVLPEPSGVLDAPYQLRDIRPNTEPHLAFGPPGRFYGNEYFHILELTPIETGYRAYVCDGLYRVFRDNDPVFSRDLVRGSQAHGKYIPVVPHAFWAGHRGPGFALWRVEFTHHSPDPSAPAIVTVPQEGPNPAAVEDVFGPWRITGASADTSWEPTPGSPNPVRGRDVRYRQLKQACLDQMPHNAAQQEAFYNGGHDAPPTAEPAVPGWPSKTT